MATNWKTYSEISYRYQVYSDGRIYDKQLHKCVSQQVTPDGYFKVTLRHEDGKRYTHSVHRLVQYRWSSGGEKETVNHKDGNKANNCFENLEWATRSEQTQHAWDMKLIRNLKSRKEGIREKQGKPIKCLTSGEIYGSIGQAAEELGLKKANISAVCLKKKGFKSAGKYESKPRVWRFLNEC